MKLSMFSRYAVRSLARHVRRTALSVVGIGLGCGVSLLLVSFVRGEGEMMMRAAAESGTGHLRVVPQAWTRTRKHDLRLPAPAQIMESLSGIEGLEVVTPRARADALLAFGTRSVGVEMIGVRPDTEQEANRLVRHVAEGDYLQAGASGTVVAGAKVAERLEVGLGDDLMVTVSGKGGEMRSAMLRIVGLVKTGSGQLDAGICHVHLQDVERITGYQGAGEITILLEDPDRLEEVADQVRKKLPAGVALVTWVDMIPELAAGVEIDKTWTNLMVGLVVMVVLLGIASAQLTAVLERRREFAMLAALGMRRGQLVRIMLVEGAALGLLGTGAALAVGVPLAYLMAVYGIDFSGLYGESDLAVSNILLDPVIYGAFGWWLVPLALGLSLTATVLSSLYPAWYAARTDPATALRVQQ